MKRTCLSVRFVPSFIRLAEVEKQLVPTFLGQLLHYVECAFAEGLAHRVEEHKHQVCLFSCTKISIRGARHVLSRTLKLEAAKTYLTK